MGMEEFETAEQLLHENNLADIIISGLEENQEKNPEFFLMLQEKGYLDIFDSPKTLRGLTGIVRRNNLSDKQLNALLVYSGYGELITAGDWSVSRIAEAEKCLGMKKEGFFKLQRLLREKFNIQNPVHLHKGFGDGALMKHLNTKKPWLWEQKGIADKIYFSLEEILYQFIPDPIRSMEYSDMKWYKSLQKQFLGVLAAIVKKELKKKWFKFDEGASVDSWEKTSDFCDINDVYDVVNAIRKNPEEYIGEVYDSETGEFIISIDFESDARRREGHELEYLVQKFLGKDHDQAVDAVSENYEGFRKQEVSRLEKVIEHIDNNRPEAIAVELMSHFKVAKKESFIEAQTDERTMSWALKSLRELTLQEIEQIQEMEISFDQVFALSSDDPKRFLKDFLNPSFFVKGKRPNLNEHIPAHIENATIGHFTDINKIYDKESVDLITATRSDSHESEEEFIDDVIKSLPVLKKGRSIFIDGTRESFSRIQRYDVLYEKLQRSNWKNIETTVVCDMLGNPISCFIEKKGKDGYLSEKDKYTFTAGENQFIPLEEFVQGERIKTENSLRRKLLAQGGRVDVFKGVQRYIPLFVERVLDAKYTVDRVVENLMYLHKRATRESVKKVLN